MNNRYREVRIPKNGGGFRTIHVPDTALKRQQLKILKSLKALRIGPGNHIHAYMKGRSVRTNAEALMIQGALALIVALTAGSFIDTIIYAAPGVWLFFLATGLSLFWLRRKDPKADRPYKVAVYPLTPLIFCGACAFMLWNSSTYAINVQPYALAAAVGIMALGLAVYFLAESVTGKNDRLE